MTKTDSERIDDLVLEVEAHKKQARRAAEAAKNARGSELVAFKRRLTELLAEEKEAIQLGRPHANIRATLIAMLIVELDDLRARIKRE